MDQQENTAVKRSITYDPVVDFVRAVAIVLVITVHVLGEYIGRPGSSFTFSMWIATFIQTASKIAVPIFLILSGYLLLRAREISMLDFYKRRISRIGIPVLVWPIVYYLGFLYVRHIPFEIGAFINDYIFLRTFYHLYFLYIIVGLYWLTPFFKEALTTMDDVEKKFLVGSLFCFSAAVTILVYFTQTKINYWSIITVWIPFVAYYLSGALNFFGQRMQKYGTVQISVFLVFTFLTVCGKYIAYTTANTTLLRYLDDVLSIPMILLSLVGYPLLFALGERATLSPSRFFIKGVALLARASFGIYIIHPLLLFFFTLYMPFDSNSSFILGALLLRIIAICVLSMVIVMGVQKIPLARRLFDN
jgi:surface polysaccharide O-acyltransferase-like enzyme